MKVILSLCICVILSNEVWCKRRIFGGTTANLKDWPFLVSLHSTITSDGPHHACGGTLIDKTWVLTAAHCFDILNQQIQWEVHLGRFKRNQRNKGVRHIDVKKIYIHKQYKSGSNTYDVALVELVEPAMLNDELVKTAPIIDSTKSTTSLINGTCCMSAGWGDTKNTANNEVLIQVSLPLITTDSCRRFYGNNITTSMVCAGFPEGGRDTCKGDSGGPLMCQVNDEMLQVGIVSWGDDCGMANKPGVYTYIPKVLEFITSETHNIKLSDNAQYISASKCLIHSPNLPSTAKPNTEPPNRSSSETATVATAVKPTPSTSDKTTTSESSMAFLSIICFSIFLFY